MYHDFHEEVRSSKVEVCGKTIYSTGHWTLVIQPEPWTYSVEVDGLPRVEFAPLLDNNVSIAFMFHT